MNATSQYRKSVMINAWKLARAGADKFGGNVRDYIREALNDAWKCVKSNPYAKATAEILAELKSMPLSVLTKPASILNRSGSFWNPW